MNELENQEENINIINQPEVEPTNIKTKDNLNTVTPLSKYLAMFLFIILPFVGFWIGMNYKNDDTININNAPDINLDSEERIGQTIETSGVSSPNNTLEVADSQLQENWGGEIWKVGEVKTIEYSKPFTPSLHKDQYLEIKLLPGAPYLGRQNPYYLSRTRGLSFDWTVGEYEYCGMGDCNKLDIPPGNYTLLLSAGGSADQSSENKDEIRITIVGNENVTTDDSDYLVYRDTENNFSFQYSTDLVLTQTNQPEFTLNLKPKAGSSSEWDGEVTFKIGDYDPLNPAGETISQKWSTGLNPGEQCTEWNFGNTKTYRCILEPNDASGFIVPLENNKALYVVDTNSDAKAGGIFVLMYISN